MFVRAGYLREFPGRVPARGSGLRQLEPGSELGERPLRPGGTRYLRPPVGRLSTLKVVQAQHASNLGQRLSGHLPRTHSAATQDGQHLRPVTL